MALFASLLSFASWRQRSAFSASMAATFSDSLRLLLSAADFSHTASACCARRLSTSAANSAVKAPDAMWSVKSAAYHINPRHPHPHKNNNHRSPTQLTCLSCCDNCCDACLSCWDMEPATSLAAAVDRISPLAQKVAHESRVAPVAPTTAVDELASTGGDATASCPTSDPAP
jgi:hypothetical protein